MTRVFIALTFFLISFCFYGVYLAHYDLQAVNPSFQANISSINDYKGVVNVHSNLSIGSSASQFIIHSANLAELDFIIFTDLNVFDTATTNESYHSNMLTFNGGKYSYLDSRIIHYSYLQTPLASNLGEAQVRLADLLSQKVGSNKDDLTILAHPFKAGHSWHGELPSGLDAIEILNLRSLINRSWEESKISTLWSFLIYPFNSKLAFIRLFNEPKDEIRLWDQYTTNRRLSGLAGTEASARAIPITNVLFRFPSYKRSFEFMSNHVVLQSELTGNFQSDKAKIFNALKDGQFYAAVDTFGETKGFEAVLLQDDKEHLMGAEVKLSSNSTIKVKLPAGMKYKSDILFIRNGQIVGNSKESSAIFKVNESGTYRVQVKIEADLPLPDSTKWMSWIYTNPFYVKDSL